MDATYRENLGVRAPATAMSKMVVLYIIEYRLVNIIHPGMREYTYALHA
jgi:hypothetical protein